MTATLLLYTNVKDSNVYLDDNYNIVIKVKN